MARLLMARQRDSNRSKPNLTRLRLPQGFCKQRLNGAAQACNSGNLRAVWAPSSASVPKPSDQPDRNARRSELQALHDRLPTQQAIAAARRSLLLFVQGEAPAWLLPQPMWPRARPWTGLQGSFH
jgi:hypothetical protein